MFIVYFIALTESNKANHPNGRRTHEHITTINSVLFKQECCGALIKIVFEQGQTQEELYFLTRQFNLSS
jgi:hypothetical protein